MFLYVVRRIVLAIPVLLGILFATFALARLIPGDPCHATLGEKATAQACDAFIIRYGLDQPIPVQFGIYLRDVTKGNLGDSLRFGQPVTKLIAQRLPVTIELAFTALIFSTIIGMVMGIISAYWRNSPVDVITMIIANLGVSVPIFVLGLLLAYTFAVTLKGTPFALPPSGRLTAGINVPSLAEAWGLTSLSGAPRVMLDFISQMYIINGLLTLNWVLVGDAIKHLILPTLALGTIPLSVTARMTRSSLLEVLGLDYMRTARAKGLNERLIIFRHALRNAMLPVSTVIGLSLGGLLSGAVLTETIFGFSGVGKTLFDAISSRDYTVVQAFTLVIAVVFVTINLIVDVSYAYLDPRIRYD
ncbi:MAG: ABC transporter permease [Chloroflexi bacterium]|nr:ABC transporter permease [Chloroflexota bacterium]